MIKTLLKPFLKKYLGLFISMVFVSLLSVALLCSFGSTIVNVNNDYNSFVKNYEDVSGIIAYDYTTKDKIEKIKEIEEIELIDTRIVIDTYLKNEGRTLVGRVFSYREDDEIFKRYVVEKKDDSLGNVNISVSRKFARNNNFKVGEYLTLSLFDKDFSFYISEIVETPEAIYPRANNYVWSDNYDFGYLYIDEVQLSRFLKDIAPIIENEIESNPEYKEYYEEIISKSGITIPDIRDIDDDFVSQFTNQVLIKNKDGVDEDLVLEKVKKVLEDNEVNVTSTLAGKFLPHIAYMDHAIDQVRIVSIFLPLFFYSVTMIVIGLFINQIIKSMTPQIGVLSSIGISKKNIMGLFLVFTLIMSASAIILGIPIGYLLNIYMARVMRNTYSIPTIKPTLNILVVLSAVVTLFIFVIITTLISCLAIFKITPKDAVISNEAKRKKLPNWLEKALDKGPLSIKLGVNSIIQNFRRFIVSVFSIFASLILIISSTLFFVSKNEMVNQATKRRLNYDCQVYLTYVADEAFYNELDSQEFSEQIEECLYGYIRIENGNDDVFLECLATDSGYNDLIRIPSSNGKNYLEVKDKGIILPKSYADKLKVDKGDYINIGDKLVEVTDISNQYFHPISYVSKAQIEELDIKYVSSYIMNVNNEEKLLDYFSKNTSQTLTVFTKSLEKDLHNIFDSLNVMIYILVGFSLGMAFIILAIMSQNSLMDQKRQLTVLRAIGFRIYDISNFWTLQSIFELLLSAVAAVPVGAAITRLLLKIASSNSQVYPFILSWPVIWLSIGFIVVVILLCHLLSMNSIARWNIADNTRSRE